MVELVLGGEVGLHRPDACIHPVEHLGQTVICLRSHNEVHGAGTRKDLVALRLRDTTRDAYAQIGIFRLKGAEPPELRIDLFRGLLADVTGIEQDEVRIFRALHG